MTDEAGVVVEDQAPHGAITQRRRGWLGAAAAVVGVVVIGGGVWFVTHDRSTGPAKDSKAEIAHAIDVTMEEPWHGGDDYGEDTQLVRYEPPGRFQWVLAGSLQISDAPDSYAHLFGAIRASQQITRIEDEDRSRVGLGGPPCGELDGTGTDDGTCSVEVRLEDGRVRSIDGRASGGTVLTIEPGELDLTAMTPLLTTTLP